jgi:hypothetical protein
MHELHDVAKVVLFECSITPLVILACRLLHILSYPLRMIRRLSEPSAPQRLVSHRTNREMFLMLQDMNTREASKSSDLIFLIVTDLHSTQNNSFRLPVHFDHKVALAGHA